MRTYLLLSLLLTTGLSSVSFAAAPPADLAQSLPLAGDLQPVHLAQSHGDHEHHQMANPVSPEPDGQESTPPEQGQPADSGHDVHTTPAQTETAPHPHPSAVDPASQAHQGRAMEIVELDQNPVTPQQLLMLNMARDGSGTSWQPVDNPMQMLMGQKGPWTGMLHWSAFADYDNQGGPRGDEGFYSQNWIMASGARPVGAKGVFQARAMMSLEPLTVGERGYPLLFQVGETYQGEPLVDRQHPHDMFMELSAQYYHQLNKNTWLRLYAAPVGEPALGPTAFPHRYAGLLNPESIMGHHSQDSTHIAFGVATAGIIYKNKWQVEGSVFNGREPDENRYDFDYEDWKTAYSGRITYMPNKNWAIQTSYGYLQDPEALEPGNVNRLTSSISHTKTFKRGWWASVLSFGHNFKDGPDEYSIFLDSTLNFWEKNYIFGRVENFQRHGLLAHGHGTGHSHASEEQEKDIITAISLGIARDLFRVKDIPVTLGTMLTMYGKPGRLDEAYGNFPLSFHVFLHTNAPNMR